MRQCCILSQKSCIEKVLERFNMHLSKPISTVLASYFMLSLLQMPWYMSKVPYANRVGSIMYIVVRSCLDIVQSISVVSRYMSNPVKSH